MWKHYLWTKHVVSQSFYFWCNPRLITGVGFNTPKWEGRLNNFVDGVRKKDKLIIAGLGVKQWRPINLAQLFPHYSPIGRSRIPHEAGRSQVRIHRIYRALSLSNTKFDGGAGNVIGEPGFGNSHHVYGVSSYSTSEFINFAPQ